MSPRSGPAPEIIFGVDGRHSEFSHEGASFAPSDGLSPDFDLSDSYVPISVPNGFGATHSILDRLAAVRAQVAPFQSLIPVLG